MARWSLLIRTRSTHLVRVGIAAVALGFAKHTVAEEGPSVRVTGTVISEEGLQPLDGARLAFLLDDSVRTRTTTDEHGRFSTELPRTGHYVIQVELLGYADWTSSAVEIHQPQDLTLLVPLAPIELEEVVAEGLSICRASPDDLRAGAELLQELGPVLNEIERNSSLEEFQYAMELSRPRKRWNRGTWRWMGRDTIRFLTDAVMAIEPAETLVREGFSVAVDDSTNLYRAPGPSTLSSEDFRRTHCISQVQGDTPGSIGLGFHPKQGGANLDVEGKLWIDFVGGRPVPQRLAFTYVNVAPHLEERHVPWLVAWFQTRAESSRNIEVTPVDTSRGEYGGFLLFSEVKEGLPMITEWEVDQLSVGYGALWSGGRGLTIEPWVTGLPTQGRLLALVPRG